MIVLEKQLSKVYREIDIVLHQQVFHVQCLMRITEHLT